MRKDHIKNGAVLKRQSAVDTVITWHCITMVDTYLIDGFGSFDNIHSNRKMCERFGSQTLTMPLSREILSLMYIIVYYDYIKGLIARYEYTFRQSMQCEITALRRY